LKFDPSEALGISSKKLNRFKSYSTKSQRHTDGQTDRQMTSPYPYTGRQEFFSAIIFYLSIHYVCSLLLWNDKNNIFVIFYLLLNVVHEGGLAADRAGVDEAGNKRPHKK
jgi:hypothetical protein